MHGIDIDENGFGIDMAAVNTKASYKSRRTF